jgi:hypothetical protein
MSALAGAVALVVASSSAAWACSDKDAGLKLSGKCAAAGVDWTVANPNKYSFPFSWKDSTGATSGQTELWISPGGSVLLTTHAPGVIVVAHRADRQGSSRYDWKTKSAKGYLHCKPSKSPSPSPSKKTVTPTPTHTKKTATPTPTKTSATPTPTPTSTSGTATPATPVTRTPTFTG